MNDAEFARQQRRVDRIANKWLKPLGLLWWDLNITYQREPFDRTAEQAAENWWPLMRVVAVPEYTKAEITVSAMAIEGINNDALERAFVHECMHVIVREMRQWQDANDAIFHEERVVSHLTKVAFWILDARNMLDTPMTKARQERAEAKRPTKDSPKVPRAVEEARRGQGQGRQRRPRVGEAHEEGEVG